MKEADLINEAQRLQKIVTEHEEKIYSCLEQLKDILDQKYKGQEVYVDKTLQGVETPNYKIQEFKTSMTRSGRVSIMVVCSPKLTYGNWGQRTQILSWSDISFTPIKKTIIKNLKFE